MATTISQITTAGTGQPLDESFNTIISAFKERRDDTGVMRGSTTNMRLEPHTGPDKHINTYERVVALDVSDAQDITQAQALEDTRTSFTPGEVAVQVILAGSTLRRVADAALLRRTGRLLSNAYDLKEDQDGVAQFSSFTPSLGSAGDVISPGHIDAMASRLRVGNSTTTPEPGPDPMFLILQPLQANVVRGRIIPFASVPRGDAAFGVAGGAHAGEVVAAGGLTSQLQVDMLLGGPGSMGRLAGFTVKEDANIAIDASDDAICAGYSKEAMNYILEVAPKLEPDMSDKSMRGAVELNLWGSYVWGLYNAAVWGVQGTFDSALPTS